MDAKIKKLLLETRVDGVFHTHVSMIKPKGKFQFNRQKFEEFMELYCQCIENNFDEKNDENFIFGVAEKPQQYSPILVDVDLRIKDIGEEIGESLYTEEQLKSVVSTYQSVIRQVVDKITDEDLSCVVLEKKMYQDNKGDDVYFKHGFHLHFPFVFLNKLDQEGQIIPRVQQIIKEGNIFGNLGFVDSGEVIDKFCCKVPWLLYGSSKSENKQPYKVTKVYDSNMNIISLEKAFKNYALFDHREQRINIKGKVNYYLPRILSILAYGRQSKEIKSGIISPLKEKIRKERKSSVIQNKYTVAESIELARKLLPMIADFRASDRADWMTIGWTLYNITDGISEGLDLWCEFSSRCEDKYDENTCIYEWERMIKKDLSIGTLRHFARLDNPEEYKKFKEEQSEKYIINSLEGSHNDVAKALYEEHSDQFVCASFINKVWFQFKTHHWEQIEEGVDLREKISGKFVEKYSSAVKKLIDELTGCQDKAKQAMVSARIKQVQKMICNLKNSSYKNAVMRECCEVFYDPRFKEKLNMDAYLIGFKNGVYDLKLNIFRAGRPEDFISRHMPINYREFSENDESVQNIHTFLSHIFPDNSIREYFKDISSDIFVGGNHEKIVVFWTGEGDNGKSVTQSIFEQMFGNLAIKLNTNIITGKKPSAGAAFAELARAGDGVRWAVMEEPDNDETINTGIFKNLSGNDSFFARDLFERGKDAREIKPMFKLNFITNKLPNIKHADKAFWNRTRVLPFDSTFVKPGDDLPETEEEQILKKRFPMDKQFSKKIPDMLEPFAWVLLEHRKKIAGKPRMEPDRVREATENYRKNNDFFRQFTDECIFEDPTKSLNLTDVYTLFKDWFRASIPNQPLPVKSVIEDYLVKSWGQPEPGKKWRGYRQRTEKDIENGDIVILNENDLVDYGDVPM